MDRYVTCRFAGVPAADAGRNCADRHLLRHLQCLPRQQQPRRLGLPRPEPRQGGEPLAVVNVALWRREPLFTQLQVLLCHDGSPSPNV